MAIHVNRPSNVRRVIVKRDFEALYAARKAEENYTQQDIQHLKLVNPNAVLPNSYTSIPRIPSPTKINTRSTASAQPISNDKFEEEYQAFIEQMKAKRDGDAKIKEQLEAAQQAETEITEIVKETTNEIVEESTPVETVETVETLEVTEPVKKTRKPKKKVVEQTDEITETIE